MAFTPTRREFIWMSTALGLSGSALAAFLEACQSGTTPTGASLKTLVVAMPTMPQSAAVENPNAGTPYNSDIRAQLYEPLVTYKFTTNQYGVRIPDSQAALDYKNGWQPRMAESWEATPDGRTFTFHIKPGIMSHWGNEFTADDAVWSIQKAAVSPGNGTFFLNQLGMKPDGVKAVSKYVVSFTTDKPSPLQMAIAGNYDRAMYDSTEVKKHITSDDQWAEKWLTTNGGGFGPYHITSFVPGQQIVLEANPNYYLGKPNIDKIIYREVPEASNRLALLKNGQADIVTDLTFRDYQSLVGAPGVKVWQADGNGFEQLVVNLKAAPFDNILVRQAMAYAIPYADIISAIYLNQAKSMDTIMPPMYPDVPHSYNYSLDLNKAKDLLSQAGHPKGFSMPLAYPADDPETEQCALQIQTSFAKVGITVNLNKLPAANFESQKMGKQLTAFINPSDRAYSVDTGYAMLFFFTPKSFWDTEQLDDPQVNALVDQAETTIDQSVREQAFTAAMTRITSLIPWFPIALPGYRIATSSTVQGITWYPDQSVRYGQLTKG